MSDISIRRLEGEESMDVQYDLQMYAFHPSPPFMDKEEFNRLVSGRKGVTYLALFEDGKAVAGAASTAMTQNVREKLFSASGVWGVVTMPAARRKGYCRQVMASLLAAEKESGKVFSNLYPFRESFYERLGYITFPLPIIAQLSPASLLPLLDKDIPGQVEMQLIGDAYETYRDYLAKIRAQVHGMAFFDTGDKAAAGRNRLWAALAKVDGEIEGIMLYSLQGSEVGKFNFCASRFYYTTRRGRYLLLDWIARHTDQAGQVEIWLPPYEHPETWLADIQVKIESQIRAPMGQILNISEIGGMETGPGNFSAFVRDPLCPFNEGNWRFESRAGRLEITKTEAVDCELGIQGLTALVYGTHDPQDFYLHDWGDPSVEIQDCMRSIFPSRLPYLHEQF